jgi:putative spermidine/putrescine transport system substrate-binding protein
MGRDHITRRAVVGGLSGLAAAHATGAFGQTLPLPSQPVTLNVIDVAGQLQLTQAGIDRFRAQNPKLVSRINFQRAPSPELPGKIKAQQDAGRVDIDLVLTGPGAMSDGVQQGLWLEIWSKYPDALPKPEDVYHENALMMQKNFGRDQGMAVVYSPSGPLFEYNPPSSKRCRRPPPIFLPGSRRTRTASPMRGPSIPGRVGPSSWAMPYILGDQDPKDPMKGWDKTWAWLKELDNGIDYYPAGTAVTMKELGEGTRDMIVTTCGWDINPRVLASCRRRSRSSHSRARTGSGHAVHVHPEGRAGRQGRGPPPAHVLHAEAGAAGAHLRQGLFLSRPGRERRHARHGA